MIQLPSAFQRVNLTPPPGISCWPNRLAWPHSRRGLTSDAVRSAGARSSVGRQLRSVTILRLQWHGGVFLLLQQRPKHSREMVIMSKASTPLYIYIHAFIHSFIHTYIMGLLPSSSPSRSAPRSGPNNSRSSR